MKLNGSVEDSLHMMSSLVHHTVLLESSCEQSNVLDATSLALDSMPSNNLDHDLDEKMEKISSDHEDFLIDRFTNSDMDRERSTL